MSVVAKVTPLLLSLTWSAGCVKIKPLGGKFIAKEQRLKRKDNLLINKVHKHSWVIGHRYDSACPAAERKNSKELQRAITTAIQAWLQPLKDIQTEKKIVSNFRYVPQPDIVGNNRKAIDLLALDLRVTFYCLEGKSTALTELLLSPDIYIRKGTRVTDALMFTIAHELGHAMGLDDTYVKLADNNVSKGGIEGTIGTQPPSVMSGHIRVGAAHNISKDDANGVIWLYKRTHENIALDDCSFPDYEFEQSPDGCRPTNPLIFEIRYGSDSFALQIIEQDKNLNINARDQHGLTALHHAVTREQFAVVQKLLAHKNIDRNAKDPEGRTPLQLANELGLERMVNLLSGHNASATKITTWGKIKKAP